MKHKLSYDTLIRLTEQNEWILFNPRTRKHFELDSKAYQKIFSLGISADETEWAKQLEDAQIWDRSVNFISKGLLSDPTGFGAKSDLPLSGAKAFEALKQARILMTESGADYLGYLAPQTSILDQNHLGTFHQQIGKFQLSDLRTKEKWKWWHEQKFSVDGKTLNPTLYAWVQENFFNQFFKAQELKGKKVLDYGCGNGFYSGKFAQAGAEVIGIDTSPELIAIAKTNHPLVQFEAPSSVDECFAYLRSLADSSFDLIYMSDVLLFFFYDPKTNRTQDEALHKLLKEFRRLTKQTGTLYLMEPNGFFWLMGWYGHKSKPYSIVTEAREKLLNVSPRVDQVTQALKKARFTLSALYYPNISDLTENMDEKAHGFAQNFPLWDFYEAIPK